MFSAGLTQNRQGLLVLAVFFLLSSPFTVNAQHIIVDSQIFSTGLAQNRQGLLVLAIRLKLS